MNTLAAGTILLADDSQDDRAQYGAALERRGLRVIEVANFDEARRKLQAGRFDVAVVDVYLRPEDPTDPCGLDLVREFGRSRPIVVLTGLPAWDVAVKAIRDYAAEFVEKEQASAEPLVTAVQNVLTRRVFVVHGHDGELTEDVVDFLRGKRLWPVVLQDEPAAGLTIIEKFEQHANVDFAIVLMTPDDVGAPRATPTALRPRARQNVIFELGYFIGKLGRPRVAVLHDSESNLELPTDFVAVEYVTKTKGWRARLEDVIRRAEISID